MLAQAAPVSFAPADISPPLTCVLYKGTRGGGPALISVLARLCVREAISQPVWLASSLKPLSRGFVNGWPPVTTSQAWIFFRPWTRD